MKRYLLALALALLPTAVSAQCSGVFTAGTVCGRVTGTGSPFMIPMTSVTGAAGGTNGQIQYNNSGVLGGFGPITGDISLTVPGAVSTIQPNAVTTGKILDANVTTPKIADGNVTNIKIAPGAANTVKGSLNGTTLADMGLPSCTGSNALQYTTGVGFTCAAVATSSPIIASRAIAITQNLTAFTSVKTLGYATPGDGGGATFVKRTAPSFIDSFAIPCSINGGSGYTNGTYRGVTFSGGTGTGATGLVVVSGGVVTGADFFRSPGWGYSSGDVLTVNNALIGGTGSGFTCTMGAIPAPTGSFTDAAGNRWQITRDSGDYNNVLQFGVKNDWNNATGDAGATNNYTTMQNALFYAGYNGLSGGTIDGGGSAGSRMKLPTGTMMICSGSTLILPATVALEGQNIWSTTIKMCNSGWADSAHFITICDPTTQLACFASELRNLTLFANSTPTSAANIAMVYSNNIQQIDFLDRVAIYSGRRECIKLEIGYGGAALLGMQNVECTPSNVTVNSGITINYGTTIVTMRNVHVEGSSTITPSGLRINGGFVDLVGFHCEGVVTCVEVNIPGSTVNGFVRLSQLTGGGACTNLVLRQTGSATSTVYVSGLTQNGCTNSFNNAGAGTTTFIGAWTLF